jgi:hypothetical protein
MAETVQLQHPGTGVRKTGYYGYSWTTLFFGFFPALFRGDFITFIGAFVVTVIIGLMTFGVGALLVGIVWSFMYNKYYTRRLLERGYALADTRATNIAAAAALEVAYKDSASPA